MRAWVFALGLLMAAPAAAQDAPQVVFVQEKNPAAAGLFSFLIPGGGQLYNGETAKGVGIALTSVGLVLAAAAIQAEEDDDCADILTYPGTPRCRYSNADTGLLVGVLGLWGLSIVDAVQTAKRMNAEARARIQPTVSRDGAVGLVVSVPF